MLWPSLDLLTTKGWWPRRVASEVAAVPRHPSDELAVRATGFEPVKHEATDLEPVPVGRLGTRAVALRHEAATNR